MCSQVSSSDPQVILSLISVSQLTHLHLLGPSQPWLQNCRCWTTTQHVDLDKYLFKGKWTENRRPVCVGEARKSNAVQLRAGLFFIVYLKRTYCSSFWLYFTHKPLFKILFTMPSVYLNILKFQKRKFHPTPLQDLVPQSKEQMLLFCRCLSPSGVECTASVITSCKSLAVELLSTTHALEKESCHGLWAGNLCTVA